ncbi:unnamed protein product [Ambrosiozyma monospora]|uniref:Unnamed protein product n=1 Tax=Ambrosiozyma monospora TaxID=43982 RepID=A0A9W6YYZ5_AMBMO|nr:unnamed protein product [Ambrosiozyma monospora]
MSLTNKQLSKPNAKQEQIIATIAKIIIQLTTELSKFQTTASATNAFEIFINNNVFNQYTRNLPKGLATTKIIIPLTTELTKGQATAGATNHSEMLTNNNVFNQ